MNFQQFATSGFGTRLWMGLGYSLPPYTGHALAQVVARVLGSRVKASLYRALYANQSVVLGPDATPTKIDQAVRAVLRHAAMVSYDIMHMVARGEKAILAGVEFGPSVWADIEAARAGGHGVMFCGAHLSNFNLAFLAFAINGLPLQLLSAPRQSEGFRLVGDLRARGLLEETPIDATALKAAIRRLRAGGLVLTGVDWPVAGIDTERLPFFGRPAQLPTGHIRLAISTNARLLPVACAWEPGRGYFVQTAPPLELEMTGNRTEDVRHNTLRVLAILQEWIANRSTQWLMYHPLWTQVKGAEY